MSQFQKNILPTAKANLPLFICIGLGVLASVLSVNFSKDLHSYTVMFDETVAKSWIDIFEEASFFKENLFKLMFYTLGHGLSYAATVTLMTVFFLTIKLKYLEKVTGDFYLGTFFYLCFYLLIFEGTVLRAAFALSLVVVAIYYLKQEQFLKSLCCIILGSQLHLSAIIFLLLFPMYLIPGSLRIVCFVFFLAPLFYIFDFSVFSKTIDFFSLINPKYLTYTNRDLIAAQNSTGLYFPYIGFFSLLLGYFYFRLRERILSDRFIRSMFLMAMTGIILMWVFYDHIAVGARLGELLLFPIVILLATVEMSSKEKNLLMERAILYASSSAYFVARFCYLYLR